MGAPLLQVQGLTFAYPGFAPTLRDVSFDVAAGEAVVLLGPNGAGKSTLLNCIMGLLRASEGEVVLRGRRVWDQSRRDVARSVAYVQQDVSVGFSYSVRDYVAMGRAPHLALYANPGREDAAKVDAALERLGIASLAERVYNQLSGGQRQLVDVARAIAQEPELILFDEPTSALDYGNQLRVLRMVRELSDEGYAVLMTTHNPDHPLLLGGSVCLLYRDGRLRKGGVDELMREEVLSEMYDAPLLVCDVPAAGRRACVARPLGGQAGAPDAL